MRIDGLRAAARRVGAIAALEARAATRGFVVHALVALFAIALLAANRLSDLEWSAEIVRRFDFAVGAATMLLLMGALYTVFGRAGASDRGATLLEEARRRSGAGATYLGRVGGAALLVFGGAALLAGVACLDLVGSFGGFLGDQDLADYRRLETLSPEAPRTLRRPGERVEFAILAADAGRDLRLRLRPEVYIDRDGAPVRGRAAVKLVLSGSGGFRRVESARIAPGRAADVSFSAAPRDSFPLVLGIERAGEHAALRFPPGAVLLRSRTVSPPLALARALLELAAEVLGVVAFAIAASTAFRRPVAVLATVLIVVLALGSRDLAEAALEFDSTSGRTLSLFVVRHVLPSIDPDAVAASVARGEAPLWSDVLNAALGAAATAAVFWAVVVVATHRVKGS